MGVEKAYCVQLTPDGGYIIAGDIQPEGVSHADMYVVKTGVDHPVSVQPESTSNVPKNYMLLSPYPNPFNPTTTVSYEIPVNTLINIDIYNILGQEVVTLFDGMQQPGRHTITWNATDVPSGIYFCRMSTPNFQSIQKMVLIK